MSLTKEEEHFRSVVPSYMHMLLADFPELDVLDAAAVFGNGGYESKGLTDDQEDKPVVAGSRGGANWFQWTASRRRALEAYCKRNGLDPNSDIAAYKWLFLELKGAEKKAIPALLKATTLKAKVEAFERAYLRAGVKNYPGRLKWAEIALDAFGDTAAPVPDLPAPEPVEDRPVEDYEHDIAPAPAKPSKPAWLHLVLIFGVAVLVGLAVFFLGHAPAEEVDLLGPPVPHDRPFGLLGGGSNVFADIGLQIALAFVMPLVSAAATAAVGWIVYWWQRVLKADFDQKSRDALHDALERGMLAAIEAFGPKATATQTGKRKLVEYAAEYAADKNPGAVKHFKLNLAGLEQLAVPHLVSAKAKVAT